MEVLKDVSKVLAWAFFSLWIFSIAAFFVVPSRFDSWKYYGNFMGIDFIAGVGFFILMLIFAIISTNKGNKSKTRKKAEIKIRPNFSVLFWVVTILIIFSSTFVLGKNFQNFANSNSTKPIPTFSNIPSATPIPTIQKTNNPNPIVTCNINSQCGGGSRQMTKSACNAMTCCTFDQRCGGPKFVTVKECNSAYCCFLRDGSAKLLDSKTACDNYYGTSAQVNTHKPPDYPPCTIYYPALGYSQTYTYMSPETCQQQKNSVSANTTPIYTLAPFVNVPTVAPKPTTDPNLCSQAVSLWNDYKADFYANRYGTYSSSFEAVQALNAEMQVIQNELYSYGCPNKLSL